MNYPEESLLVGAAKSVWEGSSAHVNIGIDVGEKLIDAMRPFLEEELSLVFITDSDIRHILRHHGNAEKGRGQQTIAPGDFANVPRVLNDFDSCEQSGADKLGNKKFLLRKDIDGEVFVVTIQRGKKKLQVKTMWKKKKPGASC